MTNSEINWKQNLWVAWPGNFFTEVSFSLVMLFMALYAERLGAPKNKVEWCAGLVVLLSALTSALIAPIWGRLTDRYGHKPMMVRTSLAMTFTTSGLAFVPNVFWLLVLHILSGLFFGYVPNSTALIVSQAPKNRSGYVLGVLVTGAIGSSLVGPLLGDVLAEILGIRQVFPSVSFILLTCNLMTVPLAKGGSQPVTKAEALSIRELFSSIKDKQISISLFVISMIIQVSAQSIAPILVLYIRHPGQTENLMFVSDLIAPALGFSSMLSSPTLGKIGDRIDNHRLFLIALFYSFSMYVLCAPAQNSLQLGIVRFLYGSGTGALMLSINSLLTKITPREGISRIFSYNQMPMNTGQVIGPFIGSAIATGLGYCSVFYVTSLIVFVNFVWSLISFRKYLKAKEIV